MNTASGALDDLLACPRSDAALRVGDDGYLHSTGCQMRYPVREGLPCLYAAPEAALAEWRQRFEREAAQATEDARRMRRSGTAGAGPGSLPRRAEQRLEHLSAAYEAYAVELRELLGPFAQHPTEAGEAAIAAELATLIALRTRLPPAQGVMTYAPNVFRDWYWGDRENQASAQAVLRHLPADAERVLVLGAGAGRLTYDIHQARQGGITVGLDINPLLGRIAHLVSRGEAVRLHEFPLAPRRLRDTALARELRAPVAARPGLSFVLGDVHRPPFKAGSFDAVVTPWVVDILDEDLQLQARRINGLLRPGGTWVSFGSLSFVSADPALRYSFEEVLEVVEGAGFSAPALEEFALPYMQSPVSRHARLEEVVVLAAQRCKAVKRPDRHVALPDWLTAGREPVPLSESFKLQAASTRIHAFLMSMVDGQRSLQDMAQLMEQQRLMPRAEAMEALRGFLTRMYDESRHGG